MLLALFAVAGIVHIIEFLAVLGILYVIIQYLIPLPSNIKQAALYIIGIVALVYIIIWALGFLGA